MTARLPSPPPTIAGMEYIRLLGSGGSSDVFLYRRSVDASDVAVKLLKSIEDERTGRRRRDFEKRVLVPLSAHPNIVTLLESGRAESGHTYLILEYCAAKSFADIYKDRRLPLSEVLDYGIQLSSAVQACHSAGTAHLDIKPGNILKNNVGRPVLTDFSNAASAGRNAVHTSGFTIPWAPPERFQEGEFDGVLADVWLLGATLYTWLSGRPPFGFPSSPATARKLIARIQQMPLPNIDRLDAPPSLQSVLARAMAKRPEERYSSASALGEALHLAQSELSRASTPFSSSSRLSQHLLTERTTLAFPGRAIAKPSTASQSLKPGPRTLTYQPGPTDCHRGQDGDGTTAGGLKTGLGSLQRPEPELAQELFNFAKERVLDPEFMASSTISWCLNEARRLAGKTNNYYLWALCTYWKAVLSLDNTVSTSEAAGSNDDMGWDVNDLWNETVLRNPMLVAADIDGFRAQLMASIDPSPWETTIEASFSIEAPSSNSYIEPVISENVSHTARGNIAMESDLRTVSNYFAFIGHMKDSLRSKQALAGLLHKQGRYAEAEQLLLDALASLPHHLSREALSAHRKLADFYRDLRWWDVAAVTYQNLITTMEASEELVATADFHSQFGFVLKQAGRLSDSEQSYRRAMLLCQKARDFDGEAKARHALSSIDAARGDVRGAESQLLEAQRLFAQTDARSPLAAVSTTFQLGLLYHKAGRWAEAELQFREAMRKATAIQGIIAIVKTNLALLLIETGRISEAENLITAAVMGMRGRSVARRQAKAWHAVGLLYEKLGRKEEAARAYKELKEVAQQIPRVDECAFATSRALIGMGRIALSENDQSFANQNFNLALTQLNSFSRSHDALHLQLEIGAAQIGCQNWHEASEVFRDVLQKSEIQGLGMEAAQARLGLGLLHRSQSDMETAIQFLTQAVADFRHMHNPRGEGTARFELSRAYFFSSTPEASALEYHNAMVLFRRNNSFQEAAWASVSRALDLLQAASIARGAVQNVLIEEALNIAVPSARYLEPLKHQFRKASDRQLWAARAAMAAGAAFQLAALADDAALVADLIECQINTTQHRVPAPEVEPAILGRSSAPALKSGVQPEQDGLISEVLPAIDAAGSTRLLVSADLPASPGPLLLIPTMDNGGTPRIALSAWQEDDTFPSHRSTGLPVRTW